MKMIFTVVGLDGKEYTSEATDGWEDWKQTIMGAVAYANQVALTDRNGPMKIKSIQRIDV